MSAALILTFPCKESATVIGSWVMPLIFFDFSYTVIIKIYFKKVTGKFSKFDYLFFVFFIFGPPLVE